MDSKRPDRRAFLKGGAALAGGLTLGAVEPASSQTPSSVTMIRGSDEMIAYGGRSSFVTSVRIPHGNRPSPDAFGLVFHVAAPLQDSVGMITPSSLHFVGTTRGSFMPDIDPREHRLMIHGLVDRPLTFTMEDLKRLPSVTRPHFIECAGNRSRPEHETVQETHGMTSCAEWTGVLLSVLLKEVGVKDGAPWIVAEGMEEVKGASSIPMAKAMDDCMVAYGMNGEAVRPQNGFPLRLLGEFNWSSQRLDDEVLRCRNGNEEGQTGRAGLRCVRLVGRRSRGARSSAGSGRRSPGGCRVRMPRCHVVCRRPWAVVGSVRAVVCRRSVWRPDRLVTCRSRSEKRLRS